MMPGLSAFWQGAGTVTHSVGAIAALAVAAWLVARRERYGPAGTSMVASLVLTAVWSVAVAAWGATSFVATTAEALRNLVWLFALFRLFASDGRHASLAPIRPVIASLAFVEMLHLSLELLAIRLAPPGFGMAAAFNMLMPFRLLVTVGGLVLAHNLYIGGVPQSRLALRWPAMAVALLWGFELNLYTIAYIGGDWPLEFGALRGLVVIPAAFLLLMGAAKRREALRIRPSRAVTFQTASLVVIGAYFLAMFAIAHLLAAVGGDLARLMQLGFLILASVGAIFVLPSPRLRGWLRVMVAKHLFQHRYDYRSEWLRFTRTIGQAGDEAQPLGERAVKAVADIAESPAGLLLAPDENGALTLAARWQWASLEVPAVAMPAEAAGFFEGAGFIVDLDNLRSGRDQIGEAAVVPAWLLQESRAWALVPLLHFERLTGVVVLARPPNARDFDWEDFDLLRVVGQQLASYLAEYTGQQALEEASRFDDFHRRIAFVMHDIKNLASQLSLLARNAELHAEKPAFRDDMLVTLRNSADKLNHLLARLSRYGNGGIDGLGEVNARDVVLSVVKRFAPGHPVVLAEAQDCVVRANRESLEQVLVHLVQNAVDASPAGSPVFLSVVGDGLNGRFDVVDSGCGMSPDFVRSKLFKPFVSTKQGGFGIGAFEARELVRAMKGRLEVESREGLGSRFVVRLPLAAATGLFHAFETDQKVA